MTLYPSSKLLLVKYNIFPVSRRIAPVIIKSTLSGDSMLRVSGVRFLFLDFHQFVPHKSGWPCEKNVLLLYIIYLTLELNCPWDDSHSSGSNVTNPTRSYISVSSAHIKVLPACLQQGNKFYECSFVNTHTESFRSSSSL